MSRTLEKLTIKRFRGLRDVVLEGLGQVNIIVGPNNCGKSSVLEALELLSDPTNMWCWRMVGSRHRPAPGLLMGAEVEDTELLFPRTAKGPNPIELVTEGTHPVVKLVAKPQLVQGRRPVPPWLRSGLDPDAEAPLADAQGLSIAVEFARRGEEGELSEQFDFVIWEGDVTARRESGPEINFESVGPYAHVAPVQAYSLVKLEEEQGDVQVLDLLRDFDPHITSIEVLALRPHRAELFLTDDRAGRLPLSSFGSGLCRALHIALTVPGARNGILAIDEVDVSLHRDALIKVFQWLLEAAKKHNVQLFLTTHSLEAVDAMLAADTTPEEDIVAFRLNRTGKKTEVRRYGEGLLKRLRFERGLDIR